jgi:hypothetical protein
LAYAGLAAGADAANQEQAWQLVSELVAEAHTIRRHVAVAAEAVSA